MNVGNSTIMQYIKILLFWLACYHQTCHCTWDRSTCESNFVPAAYGDKHGTLSGLNKVIIGRSMPFPGAHILDSPSDKMRTFGCASKDADPGASHDAPTKVCCQKRTSTVALCWSAKYTEAARCSNSAATCVHQPGPATFDRNWWHAHAEPVWDAPYDQLSPVPLKVRRGTHWWCLFGRAGLKHSPHFNSDT